MLGNPARILCIGKDSGLLRSRCAVLTHAGYHAEAVMFAEAESLLRTAEFDLIILSANPLADIRNTRRIAAVYHRGNRIPNPPPQ